MAQENTLKGGTQPSGASIFRLVITNFRGIESLTWYPHPGVNVLLGGGDVGKSTVLDAIALLLSPTNTANVSDIDYRNRKPENEFCIEAAISLPGSAVSQQKSMNWPWGWDGKAPTLPKGENETVDKPVYVVRVRGTPEIELTYEIVQPDSTVSHFAVGLRRQIGLVRLAGDDRNDRDLRLVQGSALDRLLLSDKGLRGRLGQQVAGLDVRANLKDEAKEALSGLDKSFKEHALPTGLNVGLTGGQGLSIAALIGLTATKDGIALPLVTWGAGTRRLASLAIAGCLQGECPITIVDEIERGLETYRQRSLMADLQSCGSQVFLTTHSAVALRAASKACLWYMDGQNIGLLEHKKIAAHRDKEPDTFLSKVAVIGEGITEVGFLTQLIEDAISRPLDDTGIYIATGGGNETALELLEALKDAGLRFGGLVDNENKHPTRWANVKAKCQDLLFQWTNGCTEGNVIEATDNNRLEDLITDPNNENTGVRLRTLAIRLGIKSKDFATIKAAAGANLVPLIIEAATGSVPVGIPDPEAKEFKRHARYWFKTLDGGKELARKAKSLGAWKTLKPHLAPFLIAVCLAAGLEGKDIKL